MSFASRSWALALSRMRRSRWGVRVCDCGCWLLVDVALLLASSDPPLHHFEISQALAPLHPHICSRPRPLSRSRSRSRFRLHPYPRANSRTCPPSRPRSRSCFRHRLLPPVPGALFSPRFHIVGQAPSLAVEAAGYLQAPPLVCRNDTACGMTASDLLCCLRVFFTLTDRTSTSIQ